MLNFVVNLTHARELFEQTDLCLVPWTGLVLLSSSLFIFLFFFDPHSVPNNKTLANLSVLFFFLSLTAE